LGGLSIRGRIIVSSLSPVDGKIAETTFAAGTTVASPADQADHEIRGCAPDSGHDDQILPELSH
jgi:hypothetical protein